MVIVMQEGATEEQIQHVIDRVVASGFDVHRSTGASHTVLGAVGVHRDFDHRDFELLQGVREVVRITQPFKLASRQFKPQGTVIDLGRGVKIGGPEVVVAAGPCSVESREQILAVAEAVSKAGAKIMRAGAFKPRSSPYAFQGMGEKGLQLMREVLHQPVAFGMLVNPTSQNAVPDSRDVRGAAAEVQQQLIVANASNDADIDAAFAEFERQHVGALLINPDPFLFSRRDKIVALAMRGKIATIFHLPDPVAAGGLMSYGSNIADTHRLVGIYTGRVLKGEKPADLPVQQIIKIELYINLKTAKALGLSVPNTLIGRADEVIE